MVVYMYVGSLCGIYALVFQLFMYRFLLVNLITTLYSKQVKKTEECVRMW